MAIFGAIPMPRSGGEVFNAGVDTMIKQLMDRQHQQQQQQQFAQELALKKQAAGRASQAAADSHQAAQDAHERALMETDPARKIAYIQQLMQGVGGMGGQQATQQPMPTQEYGQGLGMLTPEGMQDAQQQPQAQQMGGGMGQDALKAQMMKMMGFDPNYETPEMKSQRELETYRKKQEIKSEGAGGEALTTPIKTKLQNVITGVDSAVPVLEDLLKKDTFIPHGYEFLHPAKYADYHTKVNSIIEPLIGAMGLNVTDATKEMMAQQVTRKTNESTEAYKKRLGSVLSDLKRRQLYAHKTLKSGRVPEGSDLSHLSDEELAAIAGGE
jgi:hypothetical protein